MEQRHMSHGIVTSCVASCLLFTFCTCCILSCLVCIVVVVLCVLL